MFSDKDVIEASRKFVCVRIESYGSEENQQIVRSYLGGAFANTAFCILAPDGEERLTRSGRGPRQALTGSDDYAEALNKISARYQSRGDRTEAALPEFPSFKLALNVASADQRVLVLIAGTQEQVKPVEERLRSLVWNPMVEGRFHYDVDSTGDWKEPLSQGGKSGAGIYLIKPDTFGLEGEVLDKLPLNARPKAILAKLAKANERYAATTEKKVYSDHVTEGRRQGIQIEMAMPYGEDRDGDGEIDPRPGSRRR